MSGHSKWSTIKRQKGSKDQKKGQIFTKLTYAITVAVRESSGVTDPNSNFRLRLAIDAAKNANMPKENINRAIEKANSKQEGDIEEIFYEGFGPGGFSVIVETLTDKKQRTVAEVKNVFEKNGGSLGVSGSVLYQFEKKGMIVTLGSIDGGKSLDEVFLIAADCGATDIEEIGNEIIIYTVPQDLAKIRDSIQKQGIEIKEVNLFWKPINIMTILDKESAEKAIKFVEKLEDLDDVNKVYVNFDFKEELMEGLMNA